MIDMNALLYSIFEIIIYHTNTEIDTRVKILRMLVVLRLIRIFKFSTFSKGVNVFNKNIIF